MLAPRLAAGLIVAGLLAGGALAQPTQPGTGVVATQAWSRATPPGAKTAAVYVTLKSPIQDRLVGVATPEAKKAEIHLMTMDGNVMRMREVAGGLALPPGQPVSLVPGGYHIMLVDLAGPLTLGQTFPLRLIFQVGAPLDIEARVAAIGASAPQ